MVGLRQAGFTIIEITMFMAISSLLFLIAVLGTGNTIRTVRFSDSGRSLEAYVQKQYDDIVNGLNNRTGDVSCNNGVVDTTTSQDSGTSNCMFMGRLLVFRTGSSTVTAYNVVGTEPSNVNYSQSDDQLVTAFQPKAITNALVTTYDVPWGAQFSGFKRTLDSKATNGLLLVRSPKSSRIVSYTFVVPATVQTNLTTDVGTAANLAQPTNFCIKNNDGTGLPAKLVVSGGGSQSAVSIKFDASVGDCNGI